MRPEASRPSSAPGAERAGLYWAGLAVALGAVGVVLTSLLYALSPPRAALPMPNPALPAALLDTVAGRGTLAAAGAAGVVSDIVFAAGALAVLAFRRPAGWGLEPLGWAGVAISNLIFVAADGLSAGVLPRLAALDGGAAAFAGLKLVYDMAFIAGTLAFGLGGLAVLSSELLAPRPLLPRLVLWIGLALSLAGLLSAAVYFANVNLAVLIGISVGGGACVFAAHGAQLARSARAPISAERLAQ